MIKATLIKAFSFLKKDPAPISQKDLSRNILLWGRNNDEPLKIINTLNGSITGKACINTIRRYTFGKGLNISEENKDFKTSPGYSPNQLHRELSSQLTKLRGVAIHVKYTSDGKIGELRKTPFENYRLVTAEDDGEIKKLKYNPYWGTSEYSEEYTKDYDLYDSRPEVIREQIRQAGGPKKWNGQIYYKSLTSEFNEFYPLPDWWSNNRGKGGGRKWMEIEQLVSDFHEHNIDQGFLQNVMLKVIGDPDAPIPEDKSKADAGDKFKTVGKEFEKHLNEEFAGPSAKKMLIMWAENKDEFPALEAFPSVTNHDIFITLQKLTTENILIATQVPPVLAGVKVSGTLSKDDIENSVKLMWSMVEDDQVFLEEIYNELFPLMPDWKEQDVNIINYSPVMIVMDDKIWNEMTSQEKRQWIIDNTDIEINGMQANPNN